MTERWGMTRRKEVDSETSGDDFGKEWSIWAALALLPFGPWWVFYTDHL